jgi:hypothetical protein
LIPDMTALLKPNLHNSQSALDCGGKRSATPLFP